MGDTKTPSPDYSLTALKWMGNYHVNAKEEAMGEANRRGTLALGSTHG